ncbi:hypothetical protein [Phycicoccus sp. Soil802]|uniref:hypothetical protein n=1 Tax=Phycicoccus sp. Soil802 TaxID=1736414 RepID=UPI000702ED7F|nr:hypothetical protein [Phycicoccus sp. Soil802]KRF27471.1 hypothetical protein ASG91_13645 [Phycicoccus sp. Soil802]
MNDWIWLDPQELASAGVLLRDVSQELIDSTHRTRAACCVPGLGRHAGPLMGEAETVVRQVETVTEVYLRLAIDVLQRAIAAVQDAQMPSAVGSVGSVSSAIIGGSTVGGFVLGEASPVSTAVIGGSTVGGFVLGEASSVSTAIIGGSTVGGFVLGEASPVSTAVIGGTTVGGFVIDSPSSTGLSVVGGTTYGSYFHGGGSWSDGVMALTQVVADRQEKARATIARLQASGGGGVPSGDLGTQMLTKMNNDAMLKNIRENEIKMAASSPIAGLTQAHAADQIDHLGREARILDQQAWEKKKYGY